MKKFFKWLLFGSVGFVVLILILGWLVSPKEPTEEQKVQMTLDSLDKASKEAKQNAERRVKDSIAAAQAMANAPKIERTPEAEAVKSSGLGVSLAQATEKFSEIQGVQVIASPLADGRKRTMLRFKTFVVECIGEHDNLSKVTFLMLNDGNQQTTELNAAAAVRLFKNMFNVEDIKPLVEAIRDEKKFFFVGRQMVMLDHTKSDGLASTLLTIE